jgi:outer membrane receptor protein involved in Fe transport
MAGVYLNSKIEEYSGYNQFSQFQNFSGNPYPYTPEFQGNALLAYDQPVTDTLNINGTIAVSYQSKTNASAGQLPDFKIDGYALAGITFGVAAPDGEWSVQGYVNNLFDKYYWVGVESATDSVFRFAGMPRQFGVRLGFKF